jgi:peptidoglycan/LPS O-acetylase OafA/YrhL
MYDRSRLSFIDGCRGLAAGYVAIAHIVRHQFGWTEGWLGLPWLFGQEAVVAFFLLSGYVIEYSVGRAHPMTAGQFLWRRFLRLYPLLLLALLVSYSTASLAAGRLEDLRPAQALGNLFALQDFSSVKPGAFCDVYWGNAALWSLSYECWFYLIYTVLRWRVSCKWRTTVAGLISLFGVIVLFLWPNGFAYWATYFVIWWIGRTLAYDATLTGAPREGLAALRWLIAVTIVVVIGSWQWFPETDTSVRWGVFPGLITRHFICALLLTLAVHWSRGWTSRIAERVASPFASISTWSYALFLLHFPLAANAPWLSNIL